MQHFRQVVVHSCFEQQSNLRSGVYLGSLGLGPKASGVFDLMGSTVTEVKVLNYHGVCVMFNALSGLLQRRHGRAKTVQNPGKGNEVENDRVPVSEKTARSQKVD